MSFSICSINVRGIRGLLKRKAVFLFCKKFKVDFVFLQETHASDSDFLFWKNQWGNDIWMSYGTNHSAGVAILKGTFKGKVVKCITHEYGRWLILIVEFLDNTFILGNIYGTNSSHKNRILFQNFEDAISTCLSTFVNAKLILGGDWNSVIDPLTDCSPPRLQGSYGDSKNICLRFNCCDVWRKRNPGKSQFTWCNKDLSKQSRIDYWLISNDLSNHISEAKIEPSVLTDHKVISLCINLSNTTQMKKHNTGYWKLNNTLLKDAPLRCSIKATIAENWEKAKKDNSFGNHWEYTKFQIRLLAIKRGKELAKEKTIKEESILKEIINIYGKEFLSEHDKDNLCKLQLELDSVYDEKARGAFIRSRKKWLEEGERNTKYFYNLEKRNANFTSIFKLKINDQVSEDPIVISSSVANFYKKLYTSNLDLDSSSAFLSNIKKNARCISDDLKESCDHEITLNEVKLNIAKLKDNKAPGNDGLTNEFYKEFQDDISDFLVCVFKEAIEIGGLPPSMSQGLISLIPKSDKDRLNLDNWRPITLINSDAKLFSSIFAHRLKACLHSTIDDCQSGFMSGRHIGNNIRLILDLIDYREFLNEDSLFLFVDFYKAFDTVEHHFIFDVLEFFGFGDYFQRAIRTMYHNCNSSVKLPFGTTARFKIGRGIKQGDPAAPFLFLLVMQALSLHISQNHFKGIQVNGTEIKCSQLADDTTLFLYDKDQIKIALDCLDHFSKVSGLTLNINKCELFALKDGIQDCTVTNGIPVREVINYLGIKICKNEKERLALNFNPLLDKIKTKFNMWLSRDLSLKGRILLSKSEGLSRLIYTAMVLDVPKSLIKDIDSVLFNFVWKNKHHYLKRDILCNSVADGGLDMIDFGTSNVILKAKWIKNYIQNKNKLWFYIPNLIFDKLGGIEFLLNCNFDVQKIPYKLSSFHKQILLSWLIIYKHNFSPHKCMIWNNKDITYKRKTLYLDSWVKNNILLVSQLLNVNANLYSYEEFIRKYNFSVSEKEMCIVFNSIPAGLLKLMQGYHFTDINISHTMTLRINGVNITDKKVTNKLFRKMCQTFTTPQAKHKWSSEFRNINWKAVWNYYDKYCVTNKVKEISFKIIHLIYPSNELLLRRFRVDISENCSFCNDCSESIGHLFYECVCVRFFWLEIEFLFNMSFSKKVQLKKKDVIFFYENCEIDSERIFMLNIFILFGKFFIHKCKWSKKKPRIQEFKIEMVLYFKSLQGLKNKKAIKTLDIYKALNLSL